MSRIELLPPPPEACLEKAYPSSQKGGTLIAAGVVDLETHKQLLCDPDHYRPAMCPNCRHDVLHVHDYRGRTLRGELERVVVLVLRYRCANPDCQARWQVLPQMIARHLQRTWAVVEAAVVGDQKTGRRRVPPRTKSRWKSRLHSSARRIVKGLASSSERHLQLLSETVGQHVSRAQLVEKFRLGLVGLAALVHRHEPGVRLM